MEQSSRGSGNVIHLELATEIAGSTKLRLNPQREYRSQDLETKSYARKTVIRHCLPKNKMPNTTWKRYARNRNSAVPQ
jgi:hypothetical protein